MDGHDQGIGRHCSVGHIRQEHAPGVCVQTELDRSEWNDLAILAQQKTFSPCTGCGADEMTETAHRVLCPQRWLGCHIAALSDQPIDRARILEAQLIPIVHEGSSV
jgi:hypothetical protein